MMQEPIIHDDDVDLENEVIHVNGRRLTDEYADEIAEEAARYQSRALSE